MYDFIASTFQIKIQEIMSRDNPSNFDWDFAQRTVNIIFFCHWVDFMLNHMLCQDVISIVHSHSTIGIHL